MTEFLESVPVVTLEVTLVDDPLEPLIVSVQHQDDAALTMSELDKDGFVVPLDPRDILMVKQGFDSRREGHQSFDWWFNRTGGHFYYPLLDLANYSAAEAACQ